MRIALCDDEEPVLTALKNMIADYSRQKGYETECFLFLSPCELLQQPKYDFYILDCVMPQMGGVDLAEQLDKKYNGAVTFCFLTSYENAAVDVINRNLRAEAFLTKPVNTQQLFALLDKMYHRSLFHRLLLKKDGILTTVYPQDILCLEAMNKSTVLTFYNRTEEYRYSITDLEQNYLPPAFFVRVHRSYIVNMMHIRGYDKKNVYLKNGNAIPLKNYKEFEKKFADYNLNFS